MTLTLNTPIDAPRHYITLLNPCADPKIYILNLAQSSTWVTLHKISYPFSRRKLVEKLSSGVEESASGCWIWTHTLLPNGYAQIAISTGVKEYVHRLVYVLTYGPIAEGKQLDHLCRNRACCRPDHPEQVTCRENLMRAPETVAAKNAAKTACNKGHTYSGGNLYLERYTYKGRTKFCRRCRICRGLPPARKEEAVA